MEDQRHKPFRILSLSGGGIRGVFQAVCLQQIAEKLGQPPFAERFDLIAGTSTGSLLAFGVALGVPLDLLVHLFREEGHKIFKPRLTKRLFGPFAWGPRYSASALRESLEQLFKNRTLGDCRPPVVITAAKLDQFGHRVFTGLVRHSDPAEDRSLRAVDVALASCAAPTYFPAVKPIGQERTYVDGGMWANNPTLVAVLEAHAWSGIPFDRMRVLSIGNGTWPAGARTKRYQNLRALDAIGFVFDMMFSSQMTAADDFAETLVGKQNIVRINAQLQKFIPLDDVDTACDVLPPLAEQAVLENLSCVQELISGSVQPL